jgi:hypothetical protein
LGVLKTRQISPYDVSHHPLIDKCSPRSGRRGGTSESGLRTACRAGGGLLVIKAENAWDTIWPNAGIPTFSMVCFWLWRTGHVHVTAERCEILGGSFFEVL